MSRIHSRIGSLLAAAGVALLGLTSSVALASGGLDWSTWIPNDSTVLLEAISTDYTGMSTSVSATRGPISGGVCNLRAQLTTNQPGLLSVRLLMADDGNQDGTIQTGEWSVVGVASISTVGGITTADTGWIPNVPAIRAAYRVEHTWQGFGTTYDDVLDSNLTTQ